MRTLLALLVGLVALPASAQTPGWQAYPAYNEVSAVTAAPDGLWAATDGGVFVYGVPGGEIETVTSVEGLQGGRIGALTYDRAGGALWIGYENGVLERLDPETRRSTPFFDITRADQYPSRGVRRLVVAGRTLYAATDFGVVVFDLETNRVRDAYARIGDLPAGTPVNDVVEAPLPDGSPGLWVASAGGVHYARRGGALQAPGAWTRDARFSGPAFSVAVYQGGLYVGGGAAGARDLYRRNEDGGYGRQLFTDNPITTLAATADRLYAVAPAVVFAFRAPGVAASLYLTPGAQAHTGLAVGPEGTVWVGDAAAGLFRLPPPPAAGSVTVAPETVAPPGPLSTNIVDLDVGDDGTVWLSTERLEAAGFAAVSRLQDGAWTSFRTDDPDLDIARASFLSGEIGPDGAFYAGSAGAGLTVFRDGDVTTYDQTNSTLQAATGVAGFVVVRGVAFEGETAWVLNPSGRPMHAFDGETWAGLRYPPGVPASAEPFRVAVDEFGQKWLALGRSGLAAWDTGDDPAREADDRALYFSGSSGNGVGLPDPNVRDVVVDGQGRVWLGTDRGVAFVFSPGAAFGGDPALATPQWPVLADGSDYLLRDVEVLDLEVDPAGQVWVGTTSGAYLINAAGDAVVRTLTAATSPLPSDAVFQVDVDPTTGRVFFVTSEGLFSGPGDATRPRPGGGDLVASPSPFRPGVDAEGVVVSGMSSPSSQVRVMTAAGDVVRAADVRGGSFRWDGRDGQGRPVPSGVYLVAAAGADGSTQYAKVAVIR